MITVHFHGPYRALAPDPVRVAAATAKEAIQAISTQIRGLRADANGMKRVKLVGFDTAESLSAPLSDGHEIHIVPPLFLTQKNGNVVQIVVGAVLVVVGVIFSEDGLAFLVPLGWSMIIGGVMNLLVPVPKMSKADENQSRYLGSPPNTVGSTTRIPIGYGMDLVQGQILSSDIDAVAIA